MDEAVRPFENIKTAAGLLGVPYRWLFKEVRSGRVPSLRALNKTLLHLGTVEEVLVGEGYANRAPIGMGVFPKKKTNLPTGG
jgi:hypothetical protein